jgi:hypothetical protein
MIRTARVSPESCARESWARESWTWEFWACAAAVNAITIAMVAKRLMPERHMTLSSRQIKAR